MASDILDEPAPDQAEAEEPNTPAQVPAEAAEEEISPSLFESGDERIDSSLLICPACNKQCREQTLLHRHFRAHHPTTDIPTLRKLYVNAPSSGICSGCQQCYGSYMSFGRHRRHCPQHFGEPKMVYLFPKGRVPLQQAENNRNRRVNLTTHKQAQVTINGENVAEEDIEKILRDMPRQDTEMYKSIPINADWLLAKDRTLFTIPPAARGQFADVLQSLAQRVNEAMWNANFKELESTLEAFHALPSLLFTTDDEPHELDNVRKVLDGLQASPNMVYTIIELHAPRILRKQDESRKPGTSQSPFTPEDKTKDDPSFFRMEDMVMECARVGRASKGLKLVEAWAGQQVPIGRTELRSPDVREEIERLFPESNELDILETITEMPEAMKFSVKDIEMGLRDLPRLTGQAFSSVQ
jgi:hypothetical protein